MKNYKLTLSTTELQKLSIFLVMYEDKLIENSDVNKELAQEYATIDKKLHDKLISNTIWYKETYEVIHKIRERIDEIPF